MLAGRRCAFCGDVTGRSERQLIAPEKRDMPVALTDGIGQDGPSLIDHAAFKHDISPVGRDTAPGRRCQDRVCSSCPQINGT